MWLMTNMAYTPMLDKMDKVHNGGWPLNDQWPSLWMSHYTNPQCHSEVALQENKWEERQASFATMDDEIIAQSLINLVYIVIEIRYDIWSGIQKKHRHFLLLISFMIWKSPSSSEWAVYELLCGTQFWRKVYSITYKCDWWMVQRDHQSTPRVRLNFTPVIQPCIEGWSCCRWDRQKCHP